MDGKQPSVEGLTYAGTTTKNFIRRGVCSRRAAEKLIASGAVTVNGEQAQVGDRADLDTDTICVNGRRIGGHESYHTIVLYKPAGVVTTMSDEKNRKTVAQLVKNCPVRVLPVGRLDQYSEGMLLMTNDGALLAALTHPRNHVDKTYAVTVRGDASRIQDLSKPMVIDGYRIRPAQVKTKKMGTDGVHELHITIHEGTKPADSQNVRAVRVQGAALMPHCDGAAAIGEFSASGALAGADSGRNAGAALCKRLGKNRQMMAFRVQILQFA